MQKIPYSFFARVSVWIVLLIGSIGLLFFHHLVKAQTENSHSIVTVLNIQGAIGPAVQDYIQDGIKESESLHSKAIVLTMDTPGGLDTNGTKLINNKINQQVN